MGGIGAASESDVAEPMLAASRRDDADTHFRALAAHVPGICWLADAGGKTYWLNARGLAFHGGLGGQAFDRLHPDDRAATPAWAQVTDAPMEFSARQRNAAGDWCRLLNKVEPVRDAGGRATGWCGIQIELPDAPATAIEQRLAESEALLSAFMEHAPVGMHLKDAEGRYLRINPELAVAMDLTADEVLGQHPADLFPADVAERVAAMEAAAMAGNAATAEFLAPPKDRYAAMLSIVFPIPGDYPAKTGGFTLDLTDRKASEAALQRSRDALYQSEKLSALGSLLAGVSHELNNPLSIVVAQAVMMERQAKGTELAERAVKIRKAADRCARIVQTFLAMARQKKPERTAVDLSAVADAAIELANYGLRSDGVGITRALAPDLPRIMADGDQLHQIVTNLIVNAQQAMAQMRGLRWLEVRTALGDEPHTVILEVSDSGPGIPLDARRRIFEPFFTTKPQGEGTGMGLSFSQGLAEAHGGRLTLVPSERGACFRLTLPIDEQTALPRVEPAPARAMPVRSRRALIVDDEEEIASSLADFLSIEGFECEVVIGGAAAQRRLADGLSYDLVVSDVRMPDVDGPALWVWIGAERPDLVARTAFTTGDTLGSAASRFLADAGRPVLEKPFMPDSLRHFLAEILPE